MVNVELVMVLLSPFVLSLSSFLQRVLFFRQRQQTMTHVLRVYHHMRQLGKFV